MANKRWQGDLNPVIAAFVITLCGLSEKGKLALVLEEDISANGAPIQYLVQIKCNSGIPCGEQFLCEVEQRA